MLDGGIFILLAGFWYGLFYSILFFNFLGFHYLIFAASN